MTECMDRALPCVWGQSPTLGTESGAAAGTWPFAGGPQPPPARFHTVSARYNLLSPELKVNPYPAYAEMRRDASRLPGGAGRHVGRVAVRRRDVRAEEPSGVLLAGLRGPSPTRPGSVAIRSPSRCSAGPARARATEEARQQGVRDHRPDTAGAAACAFTEQIVAELPSGQPVDIVPRYACASPPASSAIGWAWIPRCIRGSSGGRTSSAEVSRPSGRTTTSGSGWRATR